MNIFNFTRTNTVFFISNIYLIQNNFFLKRKGNETSEILNNLKINFYNNFIISRINDKSLKTRNVRK